MKTYPEVMRFDQFCGVLCSHIVPRHELDEAAVRWAYCKAIEMYYRDQKVALFKRDENHNEQTWEQHLEWQHNFKLLKALLNKWKSEPLGHNRIHRGTGH